MPINMVNDRAVSALTRIERALARIESVAVAPVGGNGSSVAFAQLEQRHAALRRELAVALADIDALISQSDAASS